MGEVYAGPGFRACSKPGCGWPAVATLGFDYNSRTAWIDEIAGNHPDPTTYDLCSVHVARFSPPLGWTTQDRRLSPSRALLDAVAEETSPPSPGIGDFIRREPPPEVAATPRRSRALPESSAGDGPEMGDQVPDSLQSGDSQTPHAGDPSSPAEAENQEHLPVAAGAGSQSLLDL